MLSIVTGESHMMFLDSRTGYNLLRNVGAAYIFVDRKTSLSGLTFLKNGYIYFRFFKNRLKIPKIYYEGGISQNVHLGCKNLY